MYREIDIVSNRLSEKALFFLLLCRLSFFVSYCLITKQLVALKGLRHYSIVLFKRLIVLSRIIGYMRGSFKITIVSEVLKEVI